MKLKFTIILLFIHTQFFAQNFEWIKSSPINFQFNPSTLNAPIKVNNNQIISLTYDTVTQLFGQNAFGKLNLISYDLQGNQQWNFTFNDKCEIREIEIADNGIIYCAGLFLDDLIINSNDTLLNNGGFFNTDVFMIAINQQGQLLWKRNISTTNTNIDFISALACDNFNNCYYAYSDFNDGFITKIDVNGNDISTKNIFGAKTIGSISFDSNNNLYIAGAIQSGNFSIDVLNYTTIHPYGLFIARLDQNLNGSWAKFARDVTFSSPKIKADNNGNAYFACAVFDSTAFDNLLFDGPQWVYDFVALKVDSSGNFIWGLEVPTQSPTITGDFNLASLQSIDVDANNNLLLAGEVRNTVDFGNSIIATKGNLNSSALSFLKINSSGIPQWSLNGGSNDYQSLSSINIYQNDIYFTATMRGAAIFDTINITNSGNANCVIGKISLSTISGLGENKNSSRLFYPNPSSGILKWDNNFADFEISIFNNLGIEIKKFNTLNQTKIDLSEIANGIYFIKTKSNNKIYTFKWIKCND